MSNIQSVRVAASKPYDVTIGPDIFKSIGNCISVHLSPCHLRLVCDETVFGRYGQSVINVLEASDFQVTADVVPAGEGSKSVATWQWLLERWATDNLHRNDAAVALGGGVVGDLCGFAAASYARGIPFFQVPTTLLAAVDSSVGGKTAINLDAGKNLVGAFWQPLEVFCDTSFLRTLSPLAWQDGLAELLKMGILIDPAIVQRLVTAPLTAESSDLTTWIAKAVAHKAAFVAGDEADKGMRQQLNLGHTIGHAVEKLSQYSISHGHAVAIGLAAIVRIAVALDSLSTSEEALIFQAMDACGLPTACPWRVDELVTVMHRDKKADGKGITFVLPKAIGACDLHHVAYDELEGFLRKGGL